MSLRPIDFVTMELIIDAGQADQNLEQLTIAHQRRKPMRI